jgi:hypothetical protein
VNKKIEAKIPTGLIGAAGEHFVMYQLYKRGLMVGQPPQGVADVDLLLLDEKANIVKSLQVKARSKGPDGGWHMKAKHETLTSPQLWYVFVDMEPESPVCYIIPSSVVAKVVYLSHSIWLATPGKNGRPHGHTDMRRVRPKYQFEIPGFSNGWMEKYKENWELLRTDSNQG